MIPTRSAERDARLNWRRALRNSAVMLAAAIGVLLLTLPRDVPAEDEAPDVVEVDRWSAPPAVELRTKAVELSLESLKGHPWAGVYFEGDGLGANVTMAVSPVAGVSATWVGCLGMYGSNEGQVEERSDGSLHFAYSEKNERRFGGFANDVIPIRWGERRYLIARDDMLRFVDAVNRQFEPRDTVQGMFLLREGDEKIAVDGLLPELPDEYSALIRQDSREFPVLLVEQTNNVPHEQSCSVYYKLTFDPLGDAKLRKGSAMLFGKDGDWETAHVTRLEATRAEAEVEVYAFPCDDAGSKPKPDWRLVSGGIGFNAYAGGCDDGEAKGGGAGGCN